VNIRQLNHFLAVLESGSMLRASRQLNLSQPALSKSISTLESAYGVTLFRRLARGVQPTASALALERHARRILDDLQASRNVLDALASGASGTVIFGTGASFVAAVSEAIADFSLSHSAVDFTVVLDHANHLRNALLGNQIDFFVGMYNRLIGDEAFDVEPIFSDRFVGVCSSKHSFAGGRVTSKQALEEDWVVPELEEAGRSALEAYFIERRGARPRFRLVTNADAIVRDAVIRSGMLTVMPEATTRAAQFTGLSVFELDGFHFQRRVGIVRRANMMSTPLLDSFTAHLRAKLDVLARMIPGD
jgi:DNA-binding transcriptional LysR family regulator